MSYLLTILLFYNLNQLSIKDQRFSHTDTETSQLISSLSQVKGFFILETLAITRFSPVSDFI